MRLFKSLLASLLIIGCCTVGPALADTCVCSCGTCEFEECAEATVADMWSDIIIGTTTSGVGEDWTALSSDIDFAIHSLTYNSSDDTFDMEYYLRDDFADGHKVTIALKLDAWEYVNGEWSYVSTTPLQEIITIEGSSATFITESQCNSLSYPCGDHHSAEACTTRLFSKWCDETMTYGDYCLTMPGPCSWWGPEWPQGSCVGVGGVPYIPCMGDISDPPDDEGLLIKIKNKMCPTETPPHRKCGLHIVWFAENPQE